MRLSTLWSEQPPDFESGMEVLHRTELPRRQVLRRLWSCRDGDVVLLNGSLGFDGRYVDLLYALAVRLRGRRVGLVLSDATWHSRSTRSEARVPLLHRPVEAFVKLLLRGACGPHTHVCFLSHQEVDDFVADTRVPRGRVHFTPYLPTVTLAEEGRLLALRQEGVLPYVFAGGNSSRDYACLIEALGGAPLQVQVASRARLRWPENFRAGQVPHEEFLALMARAAVVVLTLDTSTRRSVGQQTYLNAMLLGVPVVVTDAVGVRDMLTDGMDAVIVPEGDPLAVRRAVERVLDPANAAEVAQMVARGRETARSFGREVYFRRLRCLVDKVEVELLVDRPRRPDAGTPPRRARRG